MNDRPVELAEALARLPSASLPVVVTEARPPFVITHVNAAWEQACGYTAAEALGRTCRMLQGRQTDASLLGPLRDAVLASKTHAVQLVNYRKDGTAFRNALSLQPVRGHRGDVTHYIGTLKVTPLEEERASGAPLVVPPRRRRCPIIASAVGTAAGARAAEPTPVPPLPTQMALQPASVTAAALPPERARPAEHGAPPRDAALPDAPMPDADADDAAAHVKRARAPPSHQGTPPSHVAAGLPPEAQPADDGGESARDGENDSGSTDSRGARPNKTQRPSDAVHDSGTSPPADAQPQPASRAQQQQQQQAADGEDAVMEDAGGGDTAVAEPMRDATPAAQRPVAQQPAQAPAADAQPAGAQETREVVNADLSRFSMPLTLDAALRVVGEVLVVTEPHPPFRIVHVNDAWTALCGWRRDEIIGKTCAVLQGPGTCRQVLAKLSEAVSQNQSITVMVLNYTRARRPFMNMLCVAPLSDAAGERPSHYAGISRPQFLTSLLPSMERVMASLMPPASTAVSSPLPATPADASAQALVPSSSAAASAGAPALEQQDVMALAATVAAAGRLPESVRASLRPLLDAVGSAPTHSPPVATERSGEPVASSSRGNVSSRAREPSACMSDPRGGNPSTSHDAGGSLSDAAAVVKQRIAPFVLKLYDMVCSSATDYCIRWAPSGKSFVINGARARRAAPGCTLRPRTRRTRWREAHACSTHLARALARAATPAPAQTPTNWRARCCRTTSSTISSRRSRSSCPRTASPGSPTRRASTRGWSLRTATSRASSGASGST